MYSMEDFITAVFCCVDDQLREIVHNQRLICGSSNSSCTTRLAEAIGAFADAVHLVDGSSMPLCGFTRAPGCRSFRSQADYGYCAAKAETFDSGDCRATGATLIPTYVSSFKASSAELQGFVRPVPEPSSVLGTLVFGALGAGFMLKRRMKNQK